MRKDEYLLLAVDCGKPQMAGTQEASLGLLLGGPWNSPCLPDVFACRTIPAGSNKHKYIKPAWPAAYKLA